MMITRSKMIPVLKEADFSSAIIIFVPVLLFARSCLSMSCRRIISIANLIISGFLHISQKNFAIQCLARAK